MEDAGSSSLAESCLSLMSEAEENSFNRFKFSFPYFSRICFISSPLLPVEPLRSEPPLLRAGSKGGSWPLPKEDPLKLDEGLGYVMFLSSSSLACQSGFAASYGFLTGVFSSPYFYLMKSIASIADLMGLSPSCCVSRPDPSSF